MPALSQPNYPTRIVQDGIYYYCFTVEQSEDLLNKIANVNQCDSLVELQDSVIQDLQHDIVKADSVILVRENQIQTDSLIKDELRDKFKIQQEITAVREEDIQILEAENKKARRRGVIYGILGILGTGAAIIFE